MSGLRGHRWIRFWKCNGHILWTIENSEADTVELDGQVFDDVDDIQERAMESVLSVDVRSRWTACGNTNGSRGVSDRALHWRPGSRDSWTNQSA